MHKCDLELRKIIINNNIIKREAAVIQMASVMILAIAQVELRTIDKENIIMRVASYFGIVGFCCVTIMCV